MENEDESLGGCCSGSRDLTDQVGLERIDSISAISLSLLLLGFEEE